MSKTKNVDKCTKDMMEHSAICSFYPKGKITKCLKEATNIHKECVTGVSSGDNYSRSTYPSGSDSNHYKNYSGEYVASNGDVYNNGKLHSFVYDNGLRYRVRRPGDK